MKNKPVFFGIEPLGEPINDAWGKETFALSGLLGEKIVTLDKKSLIGVPLLAKAQIALFFFLNRSSVSKAPAIHLEGSPNYGFFFRLLPLEKCIHHFQSSYWLSERFNLADYAGAAKKMGAIIVPTAKVKRALAKEGVGPGKIFVAMPGIELQKFGKSARKKPGREVFSFLFASAPTVSGRLEQKGVGLLLESFRPLEKWAKLRLIWRGIDREALEERLKSCGLKNVEVVDGEVDMPRAYAESDASVFVPTTHENTPDYPFSVVESLAAGNPVIVSDNLEIAGIVKRDNCGIVVKAGSKESLRRAMELMGKNRAAFAKNAKRASKRFSIAKKVSLIRKIEQKVMNRA